MSLQQILQEARSLSIEEQKQLIKALVDLISEPRREPQKRSLRDYRGLGSHLYNGTDTQAYVSQLRSEWDERR